MKSINKDKELWNKVDIEKLEKREEYITLFGHEICCWKLTPCCWKL